MQSGWIRTRRVRAEHVCLFMLSRFKVKLRHICVGPVYGATCFTINVRKNGRAQHDHIKNQSKTERP